MQPGSVQGFPIGVRQKALLKIKRLGGVKIVSKKIDNHTKNFIYTIEIIRPKFDELYEEYKQKIGGNLVPTGEVKFDDDKARLIVDGKICPLPPYKNEHFFCRAIFEYSVAEPVDWSILYERMTAKQPENKDKSKRMVYDTYEAINKRVKEVFGIEKVFIWQGKTVKRTQ